FLSNEFKNAGLSNAEIVRRCYRTMLDREADTSGFNYWVSKLNNDGLVEEVLAGFVGSTEFTNLCKQYGIDRGTIVVPANTKRIGKYVTRLYTKALGRGADPSGLNYWVNRIVSAANPRQEAHLAATNGFFHSNEFLSKRVSNSDFVRILYRTFLDREADNAGYRYWLNRVNGGESRDNIIAGFAKSNEFNKILDSYGLK
ncbi:MAG: DUF4214 domain-containing protein, partial [Solobacterium sp.]|nr:DUF4214 domain-containing protein [Solobacterium sp.]